MWNMCKVTNNSVIWINFDKNRNWLFHSLPHLLKNFFSGFKLFMYNNEKRPNMLWTFSRVNNAKFLKHIWPFFNIMNKSVKIRYIFLHLAMCLRHTKVMWVKIHDPKMFWKRQLHEIPVWNKYLNYFQHQPQSWYYS